ncbi:MAG: transketolase C-terminal domain-containing protein [Candidatus Limivicinus sp.]|nr:transketolase C-terminal domain-containing protein [Candidatus Limivicinus sp.]
MAKRAQRAAYAEALIELAEKNDKLVVLDADLAHATMTQKFKDVYPDRFYDFGIAEADMVCAAAGMAHCGLMPFVHTFALFGAGRAYEPIRNTVAYVNANVKFALTHHGLNVGEDGGSHQAVEDINLMRAVPNMTILAPCDAYEVKKAVFAAAEINGPVYIRIIRTPCEDVTTEDTEFTVGKAVRLSEGDDICLMATGTMVKVAVDAAELLRKEGYSVGVVNHSTIKPIDKECILEMNSRCRAIVTVEEHSIIGGLGSAVAEVIAGVPGAKFARIGIEDKFGKSGKPEELFAEYGLTADSVAKKARELL